jgi:hypothetical protein|mmetsp:Transcript_91690/g.153646  ORF Transcript_91690/g.153646 Transcript_91690/m.153646 type:complete len:132 (-) Transcript_91690:2079-2474(-)
MECGRRSTEIAAPRPSANGLATVERTKVEMYSHQQNVQPVLTQTIHLLSVRMKFVQYKLASMQQLQVVCVPMPDSPPQALFSKRSIFSFGHIVHMPMHKMPPSQLCVSLCVFVFARTGGNTRVCMRVFLYY